MVVREFLTSESVDLSRFENNMFNPDKVRRAYGKFPGMNNMHKLVLVGKSKNNIIMR